MNQHCPWHCGCQILLKRLSASWAEVSRQLLVTGCLTLDTGTMPTVLPSDKGHKKLKGWGVGPRPLYTPLQIYPALACMYGSVAVATPLSSTTVG